MVNIWECISDHMAILVAFHLWRVLKDKVKYAKNDRGFRLLVK